MAIEDLVRAEQTQRSKDWPIVARLVELLYFAVSDSPAREEIDFLLRELRTPELLIEAVTRFPQQAREISPRRPAVQSAVSGDREQVFLSLRDEEDEARRKDRIWWEPLKRDLEQFRHQK